MKITILILSSAILLITPSIVSGEGNNPCRKNNLNEGDPCMKGPDSSEEGMNANGREGVCMIKKNKLKCVPIERVVCMTPESQLQGDCTVTYNAGKDDEAEASGKCDQWNPFSSEEAKLFCNSCMGLDIGASCIGPGGLNGSCQDMPVSSEEDEGTLRLCKV